jgi:hypothetical protein
MVDYDPKKFDEIISNTRDMEMDDSKKDNMYKEMERLYWMGWDEERAVTDQMKNVKVTRSPLARNSIIGAMRLLTASDPVIEVPYDTNDVMAMNSSSKLEKFCKAMWFASGRISGDPLHYDAARAGLLYSEVIIAINSTKDMAAMSSIPSVKRRMEDIAKKTPYLFEVWSPRTCNTRRDKFGVTTFHRKVETTVAHIQDVYGNSGEEALRSHKDKKEIRRSDRVTFRMYYDLRDICLWMDGYDTPIKMEEHELPFIPIVSQTVEGSGLFDGTEYFKQEPFLYTLHKTNLVERQNLMLTTLYTMIFAIGANPMFVDYLINPDNPHPVDYGVPGGTIHYRVNERREPMAKQIIDPSMMQGWEISKELESQSTIYKQTLGEPLGANAPYSMVALLSQSGRLPLIATQRKVGWAIAEALEIACKWMKSDNRKGSAKYETLEQEITPDEIPDDLDIKVTLEIEMPSDRLQAANAANMLAQGEDPLVSKEWVRGNILNIGQSEDMDRKIWSERAANIFYQKFIYDQLAALAQAKQMAMQPGMASGMPGMPGGQAPMGQPPMMPGMEGMPGQMGTPPQPPSPEQVEPQEPFPPMPPMQPPMMPRG